jgi:hypothetical protein
MLPVLHCTFGGGIRFLTGSVLMMGVSGHTRVRLLSAKVACTQQKAPAFLFLRGTGGIIMGLCSKFKHRLLTSDTPFIFFLERKALRI